jgi:DNA-binding NarL/FixJ family response regulator
MIVEDDIGWLKSMSIFLAKEEDIIIIGTASGREMAVEAARVHSPDVILMDINLNGNRYDGIIAAAEIAQFSNAKTIMMTSLRDHNIIIDSFNAGAVNYIPKEKYIEIPAAIRSVMQSETPMKVLLKEYSRLKREEQLSVLTTSEREVFDLLGKGFKKHEIETKLFKTDNTVRSQVRGILRKMGVKSSREALIKVESGGIIK